MGTKTLALAVAGMVAGVGIAFGAFTFLTGGEAAAEPASSTPVNVEGRLGPRIELEDRVFNIQTAGGAHAYLKLKTVIEFETTDERWAHVLHGCAAAPRPARDASLYVAVLPSGSGPRGAVPSEGEALSPCQAEEQELLAEFEREVGTGRALLEDSITTIVTARSLEELSTEQGKQALKDAIRAAVEELLPEQDVHRVLFTDFITQ